MIDPSGEARRWRFRLKLLKYSLGTLCGFYLALYEKPFLYDKCVCDGLGYLGLGYLGLGYLGLGYFRYFRYSTKRYSTNHGLLDVPHPSTPVYIVTHASRAKRGYPIFSFRFQRLHLPHGFPTR